MSLISYMQIQETGSSSLNFVPDGVKETAEEILAERRVSWDRVHADTPRVQRTLVENDHPRFQNTVESHTQDSGLVDLEQPQVRFEDSMFTAEQSPSSLQKVRGWKVQHYSNQS